jgi:beta-galactosidase
MAKTVTQVENEYGSYPACDNEYLKELSDILRWHVGKSAVLYSTDGNAASFLKCGKVEGVYATVDFGTGARALSIVRVLLTAYASFV